MIISNVIVLCSIYSKISSNTNQNQDKLVKSKPKINCKNIKCLSVVSATNETLIITIRVSYIEGRKEGGRRRREGRREKRKRRKG